MMDSLQLDYLLEHFELLVFAEKKKKPGMKEYNNIILFYTCFYYSHMMIKFNLYLCQRLVQNNFDPFYTSYKQLLPELHDSVD